MVPFEFPLRHSLAWPFQILFVWCILGNQSHAQALRKASWSKNQLQSNFDASCTMPTLLVEEDFTDSAFNGYNAGQNGSNWSFFASGVAFRRPNNRPGFPMAVTRVPAVGAGGWAGVLWGNRINPSGGHTDPNLVEYKIDKKDDVFITRFRAFSDFAHRNERAGVEVANMEYRTVLCPPPDYCHDLSFEAKQCFYSRPQDDLQLETNIENTTDRSPFGARRAHYNNLTTKADLAKEYDNLVIWRNDPDRRKCNIEQWGAANYGDFWLDSHMVSKLDPQNRYAIVSEVQVSLFAADTGFTLKRDDVPTQMAQVGILNVHSGFTKRADFNLDYRIDSLDLNILTQYLNRTDSATIRRGDANNDQKISVEDACSLAAFWSNGAAHPDSARAEVVFEADPQANPPFSAGKLRFNLQHIAYLSVKLPAGVSLSNPTGSFDGGLYGNLLSQTHSWFSQNGYTGNNFELNLASSQPIEQLVFTVNYLGSCRSEGFSFGLDSVFVGLESNMSQWREHWLPLGNQQVLVRLPMGLLRVRQLGMDGSLLVDKDWNPDIEPLPTLRQKPGLSLFQLLDSEGKPINTQRLFHP